MVVATCFLQKSFFCVFFLWKGKFCAFWTGAPSNLLFSGIVAIPVCDERFFRVFYLSIGKFEDIIF